MEIRIQQLVDDQRCYETVRKLRWPEGVACPRCRDKSVIKRGRDDQAPDRQRYECKACGKRFDDLSGTVFTGHHQPLKVWMILLYLPGLNLSSRRIAQEPNLNKDDAQHMAEVLRSGIVEKQPEPVLSDEVECAEVDVVAGHKGQPEAVKKKHRKGRRNRLRGARGRGTLAKEKPPVFGMIERGGQVVIRMLGNVQQKTIEPIIRGTIQAGTQVYTDEYDIYARLGTWG